MSSIKTRDLILKTIRLSDDPLDYYPDEGLLKAFEIAVALGKPLLLSGEPGTGKTKFAHWAAKKLSLQGAEGTAGSFLPKPYVFPVKSTSQASDLFYSYDAVGHFRSGQGAAQSFITLQALGQAFAHTYEAGSPMLDELKGIRNLAKETVPRSSVVLIDEVDKAPREFPNDLLHEIENYSCWIPEISCALQRAKDGVSRIAVIITSNSEKNLPNAFLRRCVFYHISFPKDKLLEIAKLKLRIGDSSYDKRINDAIDEFMKLRDRATNKKPTTSEFLDWLGVLRENGLLDSGIPPAPPADVAKLSASETATQDLYRASKSTLLKTTDDLSIAEG